MPERCTTSSPWGLLRRVAARLHRLGDQAHDRDHGQPLQATIASGVWRAPGLSCEFRTGTRPPPSLLLLTFRQETADAAAERELERLTHALPALEPPLRAPDMDDATWQAACAAHARAWTRWRAAHPDDPMAAYQLAELTRQRQSGRTCTVEVGINGREPRLPPRFVRALRKAETWRVKPAQPDPLAALLDDRGPIERLRARGKEAEAAAMEAATRRIAVQMASWPVGVREARGARRPWGGKPLWLAPGQTSRADVQFALAVYLLQAEVLDWSPGLSRFLAGYMRRFRDAVTEEEKALLPKHLRLDRGGPGFAHLLHTYAQHP